MRLRRVLLILVGLLVAGLGAAAWLLPSRIDWRERRSVARAQPLEECRLLRAAIGIGNALGHVERRA